MTDLIEALQIFAKYMRAEHPTNCDHDVLCVCHIGKGVLSDEDAARVEQLGFHWSGEYDCWASFRFGSC